VGRIERAQQVGLATQHPVDGALDQVAPGRGEGDGDARRPSPGARLTRPVRIVITGGGTGIGRATAARVEALPADLPDRVDVLVNSAGGNTDLGRPTAGGLAGLAAGWRGSVGRPVYR
jgi:hypothetical protein